MDGGVATTPEGSVATANAGPPRADAAGASAVVRRRARGIRPGPSSEATSKLRMGASLGARRLHQVLRLKVHRRPVGQADTGGCSGNRCGARGLGGEGPEIAL